MTRSGADRMGLVGPAWARAQSAEGTRQVLLGDRVVLKLKSPEAFPAAVLGRLGLRPVRQVREGVWVLQGADAWAAAAGAEALAGVPGVAAAVPVMRRPLKLHGGFAARPNDPYFTDQWHLENRDRAGAVLGPDTNPRGAWSVTRGEGVTVAISDDGFEVTHPDLADAAAGGAHFDFTTGAANAATHGSHSTCVAGLVAAVGNNQIGVTGLAPAAKLASWAVFDDLGDIVGDEDLADMFEHDLQSVQVQNHSWGNADATLSLPSLLEQDAISNAVTHGRGGRGVMIVRSGGNGRENGNNVNDDAYPNDPRVIAVAAVRKDGRVASYSNPGACLLVGAPSGDDSDTFNPTLNIYTTDRVGRRGYNSATFTNDLANYAFLAFGFSGTSASAPQISGIVALILAANPELTLRDVQQILIQSARHFDLDDPALHRNGAGYRVSDNQGFGIPDAGQAVTLARQWPTRPTLQSISVAKSETLTVPDDGLRVWVTTNGVEFSLHCQPSLGVHPDEGTRTLPLVFVGRATNEIAQDLHGKAALIERGTNFFRDKLAFAAQAGAEFAVIFNHLDGNQVFIPGGTDFATIPAAMIEENAGRALVAALGRGELVQAQLRLDAVPQTFVVTNALACEHVGLRVKASHARRGDLRITLVSPSGTRSVLQRLNRDSEAGPDDWTYWSVQHFYEPAEGTWTAYFSDEDVNNTGEILSAELLVRGVPQVDTDRDGLDDAWERKWFGGLAARPTDDPDGDGSSNAREQVLGTDPTRVETPFRLEVARYSPELLRLSWPATGGHDYRVLRSGDVTVPLRDTTTVPGRFPEAEWIVPLSSGASGFFQVQEVNQHGTGR